MQCWDKTRFWTNTEQKLKFHQIELVSDSKQNEIYVLTSFSPPLNEYENGDK